MLQNSVLIENDWSVRNDQTDLAARCSHNRFNQESIQKWLNRLPIDEDPNRWVRIKEFVRCINTTEPQTIKKGWEKTRLTESFDFDSELENEDAEEEFLLQCGMEELNLDSESETESDDVIEINPEVVKEQKKQKQSQITDFFRSHK